MTIMQWFFGLLYDAVVNSWQSFLLGALVGIGIVLFAKRPQKYSGFLAVSILVVISPFFGPNSFLVQGDIISLQVNVIFMGFFIALWLGFVVRHIVMKQPVRDD